MKYRRQSKLFAELVRNYAPLAAAILLCLDSSSAAIAASLHSFSPSGPASIRADATLTRGPSVAESRVTFFHTVQTFLELQAPVPSVVAEPVVLPSRAEGKSGSSFPSCAVLFALVSFGMIGIVSRGETAARTSHLATSTQPSGSAVARVVGLLSPDPVFAKEIEMQLRQASYDVRVAGSTSEIFAISDPASLMLILVDHRVQDWDMLRTDPMLRGISLMGVVPRGHLYTEDQCLSDLERGMDGIHDFRDSNGLFLARVRAYVRRVDGDAMHRGVYQVGTVQLDADTHEVTIAGREVKLSAKPFAILAALMREPSKIFSRSELVNLVWGRDFAVGGHALDVHIHALRQQLDREPDHHCRLITIKGVGFKLKPTSADNPVAQTSGTQTMRPMAADAGASLGSAVGRLEGVPASSVEPTLATAKNWRKPSLRRRVRSLRKTHVASHRHAVAMA